MRRSDSVPTMRRSPRRLLSCRGGFAMLSLAGLCACDWVDSAGSDTGGVSPAVEIPFDDTGEQRVLMAEGETARITVSIDDTEDAELAWRWDAVPEAEGRLASCETLDEFPVDLVADTLEEACTSSGCAPTFDQRVGAVHASPDAGPSEEADEDVDADADADADSDADADAVGRSTTIAFDVVAPLLRAPVGLRYTLSALDGGGVVASRSYDFCLVSVNEPPVAVDDSFSVVEGTPLTVTADGDGPNLLSNDTDDLDVGNEPLRVLSTPASEPSAARVFALGEDGGFRYAFAGTDLGEDITDRFEYTITDGTHESTATVTVRVVARDDPPEIVQAIPRLLPTAGIDFRADLADYFRDPEGDSLVFATEDLLPLGLELERDGTLAGRVDPDFVGDADFLLRIEDGRFTIEEAVAMTVVENLPVDTERPSMQRGRVDRRIRFGAARWFSDPEAQTLSYSIETADPEVNVGIGRNTGVVSGFVDARGLWSVAISADDGVTPPATVEVELDIR